MIFFFFCPLILALFGVSHGFSPLHHQWRSCAAPTIKTTIGADDTVSHQPQSRRHHRTRRSSSALGAKLWDRLEIEEDPEPFWYLINCVAGLEIDLLRQCRAVCQDMPDAIKFVVPTEKKTRSHGAKRMVTETKVKYQGYVFAKLRLCPEVYEAIQGLDLCRSWMGTVNHKGHRKLPPAPIALNEMEVENFGLEECESEEPEEEADSGDVIVDVADENAESKIDQEAMKAFLGLKVEDMVKVTARGKFYNEDGIIRRLKDGKLFVRFYTYGTMFEEWLDPTDVRKLSNIEILKGLSGPSRPMTQRDFDGPSEGYDEERPGDLRRNLMSDVGGGYGQRNRRQDRNERRYRQDNFRSDEERGRNDRNWNWYQDEKQDSRHRNDFQDRSHGYQAGSNPPRRDRGGDWAIGNVDSQWGRNPPQNNRRDRQPRNDVRRDNRGADAAIRGDDDWSAFVTEGDKKKGSNGIRKSDDDDFFESLMNELSDDVGAKPSSSPSGSRSTASNTDDDDFFSSLMADISQDDSKQSKPTRPKQQPKSTRKNEDEDFFAALEAELGAAFDYKDDSTSKLDDTDDLFAKLEAELSPPKRQPAPKKSEKPPAKPKDDNQEDFYAEWNAGPPKKSEQPSSKAKVDDADDFFAKLNTEVSPAAAVDDISSDDFFAALEADLSTDTKNNDVGASPLDDILDNMSGASEYVVEKPAKTKKTAASSSSQKNAKASPSPSPSSASHDASSISPEKLTKQTVPQLKEMLREKGLKVSGNKAELIDRLLQDS